MRKHRIYMWTLASLSLTPGTTHTVYATRLRKGEWVIHLRIRATRVPNRPFLRVTDFGTFDTFGDAVRAVKRRWAKRDLYVFRWENTKNWPRSGLR